MLTNLPLIYTPAALRLRDFVDLVDFFSFLFFSPAALRLRDLVDLVDLFFLQRIVLLVLFAILVSGGG